MIEVEIKSADPLLLNMVLDVAEEYGGIINDRPYLVDLGYCSVQFKLGDDKKIREVLLSWQKKKI